MADPRVCPRFAWGAFDDSTLAGRHEWAASLNGFAIAYEVDPYETACVTWGVTESLGGLPIGRRNRERAGP